MLEINKPVIARVPPGIKGFHGSGHFLTRTFVETVARHVDLTDVKTVLDIGSRDCYQSLEFAQYFPKAEVFAFEANPESVEYCRKIATVESRITVVPKAAHNYDGTAKFYPIDMTNSPSKNIGASSLFRVRPDFKRERWVQKEIEVECIKVDTFLNGRTAELAWIDVQGAELAVVRGMEQTLKQVRAVCLEAGVRPYYEEHALKQEIDAYMASQGFEEVYFKLNHEYEGDAFYVNQKLKV